MFAYPSRGDPIALSLSHGRLKHDDSSKSGSFETTHLMVPREDIFISTGNINREINRVNIVRENSARKSARKAKGKHGRTRM